MGTPNKEMVRLQPTVDSSSMYRVASICADLSDIEHVHLEGVMGNKKNFDMSIIMKDKMTWHRICYQHERAGDDSRVATDIGQTCTRSIAIRGMLSLKCTRNSCGRILERRG